MIYHLNKKLYKGSELMWQSIIQKIARNAN